MSIFVGTTPIFRIALSVAMETMKLHIVLIFANNISCIEMAPLNNFGIIEVLS